MSRRPPSAPELAATIVFHDRYAAQRNGAIEFWATLTAAEQDLIVHLVRAVSEVLARHDPWPPRCPKRCEVSIRPEYVAAGRWVCYACGTEFTWPAPLEVDDPPPPPAPPAPAPPPPKDNVPRPRLKALRAFAKRSKVHQGPWGLRPSAQCLEGPQQPQ